MELKLTKLSWMPMGGVGLPAMHVPLLQLSVLMVTSETLAVVAKARDAKWSAAARQLPKPLKEHDARVGKAGSL